MFSGYHKEQLPHRFLNLKTERGPPNSESLCSYKRKKPTFIKSTTKRLHPQETVDVTMTCKPSLPLVAEWVKPLAAVHAGLGSLPVRVEA